MNEATIKYFQMLIETATKLELLCREDRGRKRAVILSVEAKDLYEAMAADPRIEAKLFRVNGRTGGLEWEANRGLYKTWEVLKPLAEAGKLEKLETGIAWDRAAACPVKWAEWEDVVRSALNLRDSTKDARFKHKPDGVSRDGKRKRHEVKGLNGRFYFGKQDGTDTKVFYTED